MLYSVHVLSNVLYYKLKLSVKDIPRMEMQVNV